ncbi:MAG: hypothetical protein HOJ35_01330 [Bdellovibrionales bacterium]|nr:hypothetical protein [Bdellovibrionales bacterium]
MKQIVFLIIFIYSSAFASGQNNFSLSVDLNKDLQHSHSAVYSFVSGVESEIKLGIQFGVNKDVNLSFGSDFTEIATGNCQRIDENDLARMKNEKLILNKELIKLIQNKQIFIQSADCSLRKKLISRIESLLLNMPGVENFERKLTKTEKDNLRKCLNSKKPRGRVSSNRIRLKKICRSILKRHKRQQEYKSYKKKVNDLSYMTPMEFDTTSFTDSTLLKYNICQNSYRPTKITSSGKRMKMLGMAVVYMSPGYAASALGHIAERYIYCLDNQLVDVLFEYTQMTEDELDNLKFNHKDLIKGASSSYLLGLVGDSYIKLKMNPANSSFEGYGFHQVHYNRDVIEVWMELDEMNKYKSLQDSLLSYREQQRRLKNNISLRDYELIKFNCTNQIRKHLNMFGGKYKVSKLKSFTPGKILKFLLGKKNDKLVIYPSQRLFRKLQMFKEGKSIFWENITFWSKASSNVQNTGNMILYPEVHGVLKKILLMPISGSINLISATLETIYGTILTSVNWLAKIVGVNLVEKNDHLSNGVSGIALSFTEIFGVRLRYPHATPWSKEESDYLTEKIPLLENKIVNYLYFQLSSS